MMVYRCILSTSLLLFCLYPTLGITDDSTTTTGRTDTSSGTYTAPATPTSDTDISGASSAQSNQDAQQLSQYLLNLGSYLGYDLGNSPPSTSQQLLDTPIVQLNQTNSFATFFGAMPVDAVNQSLSMFISGNDAQSAYINSLANQTFKNYSNPSSNQGSISVSSAIDQQTYQQDPTSQEILNILTTPANSYCPANSSTSASSCLSITPHASQSSSSSCLNQTQVMSNVVGKIPNKDCVFSYSYNQQFLSQLNGNNLLAPLLYSVQASGNAGNSSGASSQPSPTGQGLPAASQAQQAANFIRYATSAVFPYPLVDPTMYDQLFQQLAVTPKGATDQANYDAVLNKVLTYLIGMRVYAAQISVGVGNLYYIFSRRMPQTFGANPTSQALSEYQMASWRLYKLTSSAGGSNSNNTQWLSQINKASEASIQKEIAILLAEINYQLYLNRQMEERMLLTNSMTLFLTAHVSMPSLENLSSGGATLNPGAPPKPH